MNTQTRQDDLHVAPPRHIANVRAQAKLSGAAADMMNSVASNAAAAEITAWPGYAPTPVVPLPGLALVAGVAEVFYKDEAHRFTLGSFKALGGAYAVLRVLQGRLSSTGHDGVSAKDLINCAHRNLVEQITVACATDGNHGRSVAWGAQMFGCQCRIYIHENVSADREAGIANYGATVVRLEGDYDASVRACAVDAETNGWTLVADTNAGGGPADIPVLVTQGYTIIVRELLNQLGKAPTHVFIPAGVGGLAAAVSGYWTAQGPRPRMIVVEPHNADCVFRALRDGEPTHSDGDVNSFMACLSAGEVSPAAWLVLEQAVDDVVTISDADARATMCALADGTFGDVPLVSGESGCAPAAALVGSANIRAALGLDATSRVVLIGSEGATAPELWASVTGRSPASVACEGRQYRGNPRTDQPVNINKE